jgi:hypothetical protein
MRAELEAITTGFNLLPTLTGNGYKVVMVNSAGTALIASSALQSLAITSSTIDGTPIGATTAAAGTFTTLTATSISIGGATIATTTGVQTLTNKTISGSNNTLSNIANSSLTNSSVTIGSTSLSLGASSTTLAGLTSVTSTAFVGALTGNADTVTNGVYTSGSYSNPSWITTLAGSKISGNISGNAANVTGTIAIASGGTGATSASAARAALLPSFTGNAGKAVVVNATATDIEYITLAGTGTVTSVAVSGGTTGLTTSGGPITAAGTITLAGTLAVGNGGLGLTTIAALSIPVANSLNTYTTVTATAGQSVRINAGGTAWEAFTPSTSSGTVSSVSWTGGIVSVANPTTTPAFTIAGTSGGVPYFSSTSGWASSGLLAANAIVLGGGAGAAPVTTTTGSGVVTALASAANATNGFTTTNGTATLSNKRIDPRNVVAASASSLTPDVSVGDIYAYTALAATLTINAPVGTPTDGDKLIFRILDNGTPQTLTWNGTYTVVGTILPTTTVASKTTYVGCIYNANNTRWDVVAVSTQV